MIRTTYLAAMAGVALSAPILARAQQATTVGPVSVTAPIATTPLSQPAGLDKADTPIADIPRSIAIVPKALIAQQGDTKVIDVLRDVSGAVQGGQYAFGFFDRIIIRGLDASFLNDGLPDGTSDLTGYQHTLVGVQSVEVLKGPGSALFGSEEPGGTINLIHDRPSDTPSGFVSEQAGSYGASTTDVSATGPTGLSNLDWRIDGEYQRTDGFRGLYARSAEILGSLAWRPANHDVELRVEYHHFENRPDAEGIPFSPPSGAGLPLNVPTSFDYYSPSAFADQDLTRIFLSDAWRVSDILTVNTRASYSIRDVDLARNSGGSVKLIDGEYALASRQLRDQVDAFDDFDLQVEPTWRFRTGPFSHVLVTGGEAREIAGDTTRSTADLPNIANILDPVVTDPPPSDLVFKCDATHSCDNARLTARFYGVYAVDQIDLTSALKVRLAVRQNWFDTEGEARSPVPVNSGEEQPCDPPQAAACPWVVGSPIIRHDAITTWDAGAVYDLAGWISVYGGYATQAYPIFNTEEPESVGQAPEGGDQTEIGLRLRFDPRFTLTTALYRTTRTNVYTLITEPAPGGTGDIDVAQVFDYRVRGWETDLNFNPTARLSLIANLALQDDRITSYPQTPADIGHRVPGVPPILVNLWTTYDLPTPAPIAGVFPDVRAEFGVRYKGEEFGDVGGTRMIPGVPLYDLGLGLPVDDGKARLELGMQNILNTTEYLYAAGTGGGAFPGPGRTLFARLSAKIW